MPGDGVRNPLINGWLVDFSGYTQRREESIRAILGSRLPEVRFIQPWVYAAISPSLSFLFGGRRGCGWFGCSRFAL